jgi:hypothetical protein
MILHEFKLCYAWSGRIVRYGHRPQMETTAGTPAVGLYFIQNNCAHKFNAGFTSYDESSAKVVMIATTIAAPTWLSA